MSCSDLDIEKKADKDKCRSIYWNLLTITRYGNITETDWKDRDDIESFIGKESLRRITNYVETEQDSRIAATATAHYSYWIKKRLILALPLRDRIYYHTVERAERTVAIISLIGSGIVGIRYSNRIVSKYVRFKRNKGRGQGGNDNNRYDLSTHKE